MKAHTYTEVAMLAVVLAVAAGCKQKPSEDSSQESLEDIRWRPQDRFTLRECTVHFDFGRSVVKPSEGWKLDAVAAHLKSIPPDMDLLVEGHCDERGTSEYNLALGERRAAAIRKHLVRSGIGAARIHIRSFGKEKPMTLGHDEISWSQNRRGELILILPR